jgi:hypothetical protein
MPCFFQSKSKGGAAERAWLLRAPLPEKGGRVPFPATCRPLCRTLNLALCACAQIAPLVFRPGVQDDQGSSLGMSSEKEIRVEHARGGGSAREVGRPCLLLGLPPPAQRPGQLTFPPPYTVGGRPIYKASGSGGAGGLELAILPPILLYPSPTLPDSSLAASSILSKALCHPDLLAGYRIPLAREYTQRRTR